MTKQEFKVPVWADRFFRWFCAPELLEEIQGDLHETFKENVREIGLKQARKQFIWDVLYFFNLSTIKGNRSLSPGNFQNMMNNNNFRFILRRLFRQRLNSSLHILGLTIGLSVCILIGLFIHYELSFDTYHEKAAQIYRVNQIWEEPGERFLDYSTPAPLPQALRDQFPEIEMVGIAYPRDDKVIEINPQKRFKQNHILMVDDNFLDIFDIKVLRGNGHEAMRNPNQVLLTESLAKTYYGREDPIGKTFQYENDQTMTVAGIIEDLPSNTHLPAEMLMSYFPISPWVTGNSDNWGMTFGLSTFVVLKEGIEYTSLHTSIRDLYDTHINDDSDDPELAYAELQPLTNIHLNPEVDGGGEWVQAINPVWLWFFGGISLLVLLLACINFINLSTAQALTRVKEVGIRKAIGAGRGQLMRQFLGEAFLLIAIASVFAFIISHISLPYINNLLDKDISSGVLFSVGGLSLFLGFILFTGLLTGVYPAWLISRFQPALSIKANHVTGDKNSNFLRKGLVVTQFTISAALLVALIIMSQQMEFFHNQNLGFDKENVITVRMRGHQKNQVFKSEIASIPQIDQVSFALAAPASESSWTTRMHETDLNDPGRKEVRLIWADENYDDIYNLKLLAGRYTENRDTNSISASIPEEQQIPRVMVNEQLIKVMGFGTPEEALGKRFLFGFNNWTAEIVGVIADFNISSLHEAIEPLLISPYFRYQREASIKLKAGSELPQTLAAIKSSWEKTFPDGIYEFHFLEKTIERYYESESRLYGLFKIFAGLAMLISCLGLWGLATFATVQRTKEIGIRKVLGASVSRLVTLLSKDFLILVGISFLLAAPIAWYGMNKWLQNFAFRIDIQWTVFVASALLLVAIALFTVSFQSIKAALTHPAKTLRGE